MSDNLQMTPTDMHNLKSVECSDCGCPFFDEKLSFKTQSILDPANTTGQDQVLAFKIVVCSSCLTPAPFVEGAPIWDKLIIN